MQFLTAKIIKLWPGHNIPKAKDLKGKVYCKYHNYGKHATNNCVLFRDAIQSWKTKVPRKNQMLVETDPFLNTIISMVDAHLPEKESQKLTGKLLATLED